MAGKIHGRIFCDCTLKQTFRGINFAICELIVNILMISRRTRANWIKSRKMRNFNRAKISCYTVLAIVLYQGCIYV